MQKAIAIISEKPQLAALFAELDQNAELIKSRLEFLKRQAKKLLDEETSKRDALWERIEAACRDCGLLPAEFDKTKQHHLHEENGVLMFCDGNHGRGLGEFLVELTRGR